MRWTVICVFLFCLGVSSVASKSCSDQRMLVCMEAESAHKESKFMFHPKLLQDVDDGLDNICGQHQRILQCIDSFVTECYSKSEREKFDRITRKTKDTLLKICADDTDFFKDKSKFTKCYQKVAAKSGKCSDDISRQFDELDDKFLSSKHLAFEDTEKYLQDMCCLYYKNMACIMPMKEACGADVATMASDAANALSGVYWTFTCIDYKQKCDCSRQK